MSPRAARSANDKEAAGGADAVGGDTSAGDATADAEVGGEADCVGMTDAEVSLYPTGLVGAGSVSQTIRATVTSAATTAAPTAMMTPSGEMAGFPPGADGVREGSGSASCGDEGVGGAEDMIGGADAVLIPGGADGFMMGAEPASEACSGVALRRSSAEAS